MVNLFRDQQGLTAALGWYDRALAADPGNTGALIDQAATLGDLGRYRDMLVALRKAAAIVPGDPRLYYLQAVLAARAGQFTLARSLLTRTRGQMDAVPGFRLREGECECEQGGKVWEEGRGAGWGGRGEGVGKQGEGRGKK